MYSSSVSRNLIRCLVVCALCGPLLGTMCETSVIDPSIPAPAPVPPGLENEDTDGDGILNGEEAFNGTDWQKADTDGDGLSDSEEVTHGTNPLNRDSDRDGLWDGAEIKAGTLPLEPDTDGDGLADGQEVNVTGTNPLLADSDGDGLSDPQEIQLGLNPNNSDTDNDGLNDQAELNSETDPLDPDTDDDGLKDGEEALYGTSPVIPDYDGDLLPDGDEVNLGTDPLDPDTDGDSLTDGQETMNHLNPLVRNISTTFLDLYCSTFCGLLSTPTENQTGMYIASEGGFNSEFWLGATVAFDTENPSRLVTLTNGHSAIVTWIGNHVRDGVVESVITVGIARYVRLTDGTYWRVHSSDHSKLNGWLAGQELAMSGGNAADGNFILVNKEICVSVRAALSAAP